MPDSSLIFWIALVLVAAILLLLVLRARSEAGRRAAGRQAAPGRSGSAAAAGAAARFDELTSEPLADAARAAGWRGPTALHARAIPIARQRRDLLALAPAEENAAGAYLLPALEAQLGREGLHTVVLCPTRQRVEEVAGLARALAGDGALWVGELYGGVPVHAQVRDLRAGFDLLVATPERLVEHLNAGHLALAELERLVLDEADRLLDIDAGATIEDIAARAPADRQVLIFAEHPSVDLDELAAHIARRAARIEIGPEEQRAARDRVGRAGREAGRPADRAGGRAERGRRDAPAQRHGGGRAVGRTTDGPLPTTGRVGGTVKWFNNSKGYGFITPDDGSDDIFVHYTAIRDEGFRTLDEGDRVEFGVQTTPKGPEATDVVQAG